MLAEQVATLDLLSNGRFDFGVGRGYRQPEFSGFCIPIEEATERFDETMAFLRKAWAAGDRFSHHGKRWHFDNIIIEPRPVQQPHPPLWMGPAASSRSGVRRRRAINLLLDQIAPVDLIIERVAAYRAGARAAGSAATAPDMIGAARALQIVKTEAERQQAYALQDEGAEGHRRLGARARRRALPEHRLACRSQPRQRRVGVAGDARRRSLRGLKKLEAGGVDYVLLVDPTGSKEALRTFAEEIMPAFPDAPASAVRRRQPPMSQ